jgi:transcriptional regulator GlxA family with amidase domain
MIWWSVSDISDTLSSTARVIRAACREPVAAGHRHAVLRVGAVLLYVDNGQFLTSAGASAGLDLCLHMIRRDFGSTVAADAARLAVTPLEREGGQAQYIVQEQPPVPRGSMLEPTLTWVEDHLGDELTLEVIAAHSGMSTRSLTRCFREHTGSTPLQWLLRARVRRAQHLLQHTDQPVEQIAPPPASDPRRRVSGHLPRLLATELTSF